MDRVTNGKEEEEGGGGGEGGGGPSPYLNSLSRSRERLSKSLVGMSVLEFRGQKLPVHAVEDGGHHAKKRFTPRR